ncbi:membrane protein implicated in regulation of membrane protease activity [Saccharothrix ecbatanensis]|uniref:Membrane protein implicated in regulation of membrane protease activity n=1 Tax=Saccharothrix ecbatanensis TaxID=1105145 RepID=A0A7W9HGI0_9PSEU|nr:NfeD family protein [Saccharothrix ecbatanensis]MBB5801571.1 membrane protein implicated in regulation of membrane protease activity [Saccharothrix ecbatanensis]
MDSWLVWLLLGLFLGAAELFVLTAALGVLGGAALITSGVAAVGLPAPVQFVVFTLASVLGLVLLRPLARDHLRKPQTVRFGVDALVGESGYVVSEVSRHGGRVRIAGEEWTARPFDDSLVIPEGATVDVMRISGSTAFVYPGE